MKTYIVTLSKQFPAGHIRAGQPTYFKEKIFKVFLPTTSEWLLSILPYKIHTIRANYPLWEQRFAEIERGEACLSVREWSGRPRHSKQVEIARLTKDDGIGIQKLEFMYENLLLPHIGSISVHKYDIAANDGLSLRDWHAWFAGYDRSKPMAIIHFTKFRY